MQVDDLETNFMIQYAYPSTEDEMKDEDKQVSEAAKALSSKGASRGGRARAAKLSPEERSEASRRAAEVRWGRTVQRASHDGVIRIGDQELACANLGDGTTRVINQGTLLTALGRAKRPKGGTDGGGTIIFAGNLRPFVPPALEAALKDTIEYQPVAGGRSIGYRAELIPEVCEVYLDAKNAGRLLKSQERAYRAAEILHRGLARVGIAALVDEATGYQETRARNELQVILEAYVQEEYRPWMKVFPDEFFEQIYRLQGWEYRPGTAKRTPYVGHLVNKYIYKQLPPGVLDELQRLNPRAESGHRPHRFHQYLTTDTGNVHLDKQILTVTTLMRIARDKQDFQDMFERAFPPPQQRLALVVDVPEQAQLPGS